MKLCFSCSCKPNFSKHLNPSLAIDVKTTQSKKRGLKFLVAQSDLLMDDLVLNLWRFFLGRAVKQDGYREREAQQSMPDIKRKYLVHYSLYYHQYYYIPTAGRNLHRHLPFILRERERDGIIIEVRGWLHFFL